KQKRERNEDEDGRAEQEAKLAFQARFAQQLLESAVGHEVEYSLLGVVSPTAISLAALALRTEMRRAPREHDSLDCRLTDHTGLARSAIGAELVLESSHEPRAPDVVADARTA